MTEDRLARLRAEIKETHFSIICDAIGGSRVADRGKAIVLGQKLIEAKATVRHGQWQDWLDGIGGIMNRHIARAAMRIARRA